MHTCRLLPALQLRCPGLRGLLLRRVEPAAHGVRALRPRLQQRPHAPRPVAPRSNALHAQVRHQDLVIQMGGVVGHAGLVALRHGLRHRGTCATAAIARNDPAALWSSATA